MFDFKADVGSIPGYTLDQLYSGKLKFYLNGMESGSTSRSLNAI